MILKAAKHFAIPVLAFSGLVSVGFAAWVFAGEEINAASATGTVAVTGLYDGAEMPGTFEVKTGDDYTSDEEYYTLLFSEDQTFDEDVGVALYPSIQYRFSNFYYGETGSYYMKYRCTYSTSGIYSKYVAIPDSLLGESGSGYQESIYQPVDLSGATQNSDGTYSFDGSFVPSFKWKSGTKPTSREAHNAFIEEVNSSSDTFSILITLALIG